MLTEVDEPASPAMAADLAFVQRLTGAGMRLKDLSFTVSHVAVVARGTDDLTVSATVTTSAHRRVRVTGGAEVVVAASPARAVRLTLGRSGDGQPWLVRSIS
jgi:hypothetical protein